LPKPVMTALGGEAPVGAGAWPHPAAAWKGTIALPNDSLSIRVGMESDDESA
jgi:hypothetical protein